MEQLTITISKPTANPQSQDGKRRFKKSRLYIFTKGETILDDLANRRSRPHQMYKSLLPQIFQALDLPVKPVRWSQYCGCTCPCSPGFIIDDDYGMNYSVTMEIQS